MKPTIKIMLVILSAAAMSCIYAEDAVKKIKFFRPSVPGNTYSCDIMAEAKSVSAMTAKDGAKTEKVLCNRISISGIMTVKTVTEYGRPATIDFKVEKVKGDICGREIKFASENKVLEIDLDCRPCEFRIKGGDGDGAVIGKDEFMLLSLVFRKTRKENLSDFIGTDNAVKIGDSWKMPSGPLLGEFEKRGLKLDELAIEGNVKLSDRKSMNGYECWIFNAGLNAKKAGEFEFDFQAEVCLPTDDRTGAIKVSRTARERLNKQVADKDTAMMPDLRELSLEISDVMSVLAVPVQEGK